MDEDKPKTGSTYTHLEKCPVCGIGFRSPQAVVEHIKSHNKEDDEYELSAVAEQDRLVRQLF